MISPFLEMLTSYVSLVGSILGSMSSFFILCALWQSVCDIMVLFPSLSRFWDLPGFKTPFSGVVSNELEKFLFSKIWGWFLYAELEFFSDSIEYSP